MNASIVFLLSTVLIFGTCFATNPETCEICETFHTYHKNNSTVNREVRIFGGRRVSIEEASHFVHLADGRNKIFCSGSLISLQHVLTSAHCVDYYAENPRALLYVIAGEDTAGYFRTKRLAKQIYVPTLKLDRFNIKYDNVGNLAIIELEKAFVKTDRIDIAVLPDRKVQMRENVVAFGFEPNNHKRVNRSNLRRMNSVVVSCKDYLPARHNDELCVRSSSKNVFCDGNSGSGLLNLNDELVGVISKNDECNLKREPNVYTSVYYYSDFIKTVINRD